MGEKRMWGEFMRSEMNVMENKWGKMWMWRWVNGVWSECDVK